MKKILTFFTLGVLVFPLFAQIDHDFNVNDRVPIMNAKITQDQVPPAVLKAVNIQFDKNDPLTWSKFPYALKEYGWVYDVGASDIPLNRFEVTMKTDTGNEFWAIYSEKGELIQTREISKNIAMPRYIQEALAKSQYKEWTTIGNKEIVKYYHDHDNSRVEQHFRITIEKDNVKRSISFNYKGKDN